MLQTFWPNIDSAPFSIPDWIVIKWEVVLSTKTQFGMGLKDKIVSYD